MVQSFYKKENLEGSFLFMQHIPEAEFFPEGEYE